MRGIIAHISRALNVALKIRMHAALFTAAKMRKQPQCLYDLMHGETKCSTREQVYTSEGHPAAEERGSPCELQWQMVGTGTIVLAETRQAQKDKCHPMSLIYEI